MFEIYLRIIGMLWDISISLFTISTVLAVSFLFCCLPALRKYPNTSLFWNFMCDAVYALLTAAFHFWQNVHPESNNYFIPERTPVLDLIFTPQKGFMETFFQIILPSATCAGSSFLNYISWYSSLAWNLVIVIDLFLLLRNPFARNKLSCGRWCKVPLGPVYHLSVWLGSLGLGTLSLLAFADVGNENGICRLTGFTIVIYELIPSFIFLAISAAVFIYVLYKLGKGLSNTHSMKQQLILRLSIYLMSYFFLFTPFLFARVIQMCPKSIFGMYGGFVYPFANTVHTICTILMSITDIMVFGSHPIILDFIFRRFCGVLDVCMCMQGILGIKNKKNDENDEGDSQLLKGKEYETEQQQLLYNLLDDEYFEETNNNELPNQDNRMTVNSSFMRLNKNFRNTLMFRNTVNLGKHFSVILNAQMADNDGKIDDENDELFGRKIEENQTSPPKTPNSPRRSSKSPSSGKSPNSPRNSSHNSSSFFSLLGADTVPPADNNKRKSVNSSFSYEAAEASLKSTSTKKDSKPAKSSTSFGVNIETGMRHDILQSILLGLTSILDFQETATELHAFSFQKDEVFDNNDADVVFRMQYSDFKKVIFRKVSREGHISKSSLLPNLNAFKFWEYSPKPFGKLRSKFFPDSMELMASFDFEKLKGNIDEFVKFSEGKSDAFFMKTWDKKFFIKTITGEDLRSFLAFLPRYYSYILQNPETLLSLIVGLYSVELFSGSKIHFIVMNNVFFLPAPLKDRYDIKGSSNNRTNWKKPGDEEKKPGFDNDLKFRLNLCHSKSQKPTKNDNTEAENEKKGEEEENIEIPLGLKVLKQIKSDVRLLQKCQLIDYSLVFGVVRDFETKWFPLIKERVLKNFKLFLEEMITNLNNLNNLAKENTISFNIDEITDEEIRADIVTFLEMNLKETLFITPIVRTFNEKFSIRFTPFPLNPSDPSENSSMNQNVFSNNDSSNQIIEYESKEFKKFEKTLKELQLKDEIFKNRPEQSNLEETLLNSFKSCCNLALNPDYFAKIRKQNNQNNYLHVYVSKNGKLIYIMGLIDFFGRYTFNKKLEKLWKQYGKGKKGETISVQPPQFFGDRFIKKMDTIFEISIDQSL